ncbi:MAG: polysaccharide biosynthesis tyrosine autokinase [Bacteroidetes bacterium]|nr:polysaccharide biosynthesis tyrosine autokinase [Bacteroidota bacterium]
MNQPSEYFENPNQDELDVKELVLKVWYHKFWFLSAILLFLAAGYLYLRYSQPSFSSKAKIFIRDNRSGGTVSEEMIFQDLGLLNTDKNVLNEMAILKSRNLMTEVVKELNLYYEWYKSGTIKTSEDYSKSIGHVDTATVSGTFYFTSVSEEQFRLSEVEEEKGEIYSFGQRIQLQNGYIVFSNPKQTSNPEEDAMIRIQSPERMAGKYSNALEVKRESDWATLLNLSIETNTPQKSADILEKVITIYTRRSLREKNEGYERTLGFIEERIRLLTEELGLVEQTIESFKKRNEIAGEAGEAISELSGQLVETETDKRRLEIQKEIIQKLEKLLSDPEKPYQLLPGSLSPENQRLNQLIEQYNTIVLRRNTLTSDAAGPENPVIEGVEQQMDRLKDNIFQNIDRAYEEIDLTMQAAENKQNQLQREFSAIPQKERELLEIVRQQKIKESLYLYLLQKREEIALSISMATSNVRVVDWPKISRSPVSPKPTQVYAIALSLGVTLPIGIILLLQLFNTKVKSREDIKQFVSAPIVGEIMESASSKDTLIGHGKSQAAEMFRLLRTNLSFLLPTDQTPSVLVTSYESGEGKTFIAANLAQSIAITGKKVCLLGLDLRKPQLHSYFDASMNQPGITSYFLDKAGLSEIINVNTEDPNLHYIISGAVPPNPAELLLSDKFNDLLSALEEKYDMLIWDTAPVGLVADTRGIKDRAHASLFVVKQDFSQKKALSSLTDERKDYQLKNYAIVFNGIKEGSFYGYGRYRYGYGKYNKGYYK